MFNLFKKNKKYPAFERLQSFEHKDKFFVRTASWRRLDKHLIVVTDPLGPRVLTMDPWPQIVFLASDGQQTVIEFIFSMAGSYAGQVPTNLDQTIVQELEKLVGYGIVAFRDQKCRPATACDQPAD